MRYIIGIDEVGRGSLAGPVMVCAVLLACSAEVASATKAGRSPSYGGQARISRGISHIAKRISVPLRDSKRLTAIQRNQWFENLTHHPDIEFRVAKVYPKTIDRINISRAANLAAKRAFLRLTQSYKLKTHSYSIYLDGGLYLGNRRRSTKKSPRLSAYSPRWSAPRTIVRGDEKIPAIAIASIIAKVTRDRLMARLAKKHPRYGFEIHKGYGTLRHRKAIKKRGPSEAHRLTFLKKYPKI